MRMTFLLLFGVAGLNFMAEAQSETFVVHVQRDNSPIIVTGAPAEPVVYNQPVEYAQPAQYSAPVQYNAPVHYEAPVTYYAPCYTTVVQPTADEPAYDFWSIDPLDCGPSNYVQCSSVQVIYFGERQAQQQGYSFNAPR